VVKTATSFSCKTLAEIPKLIHYRKYNKMKKAKLIILMTFLSFATFAQKKVVNYYVGGLLYCKYTYFMNNEHSEGSYLEVTNTQNYNSKKYFSCATCRYQNEYKVDVMTFEDSETGKNFTLYIRDIDNKTCILIFQDAEKNEDKMEVYYAKQTQSK
jgi:hypothetical protein